MTAVAWSSDGRVVGGDAGVSNPVVPGDHVVIALPDGDAVLARIDSKDVVERADGRRARLVGSALARLESDGSVASDGVPPFDDAPLRAAAASELDAVLRAADGDRPTTVIGALDVGGPSAGDPAPARLRLGGFNRHTFVCGQSGSGKTFSLGVILERLLVHTALRIVVIDPNGDFVRLHELRDAGAVDATRRLPAQDGEDAAFRKAHAALADAITVHGPTGAAPAGVRFVDLPVSVQAEVLRLDPIADRAEYADAVVLMDRLRAAIERRRSGVDASGDLAPAPSRADDFDVLRAAAADVSPELATRIANLGLVQWPVWARDEVSVVETIAGGRRCTVADVGGLDDAQRDVVVLSVLDHLWATRSERIPTLVVVDEAHNVAPSRPTNALQERNRDLMVRIAGEGRKFGLFLVVATQRPDKVDANLISQCDNLVLLRMNARSDVEELKRTFSFVPESFIEGSTGFAQGQAVIAGPCVAAPVRVRIGGRYTQEGGSDLPTSWASPATA